MFLCDGCCGICTCGVCYPAVNCFDQDACNKGKVLAGTTCCGLEEVTCTPPACQYAQCDPKQGCVYTSLDCSSKPPSADGCTQWYCDNSTTVCAQRNVAPLPPACNPNPPPQCVVDKDCTATSTSKCATIACVSGKCVSGTVTCPAATACSVSVCKPTAGCVATNKSCNDENACTTDGCDPVKGCTNVPITCPTPKDPCQMAICDKIVGCLTVPITCSNITTGNCTIPACNQTCYSKYICATPPPTSSEGTTPTTVILVTTLTTAAVAGIVVAAVLVAAGVGAGAVVAVAGGAGAGGVVMVQSNPTYVGSGASGTNPLNKG